MRCGAAHWQASEPGLIDVDHFKRHNDRHGHQVGDRVLRDVARLIGACAPPARHGGALRGDEFALVLPDTRPKARARWSRT